MRKVNRFGYILVVIFLGIFGIHRFMTGRFWTGLLYLFTGGLFIIGIIYDLVVGLLKPSYNYSTIEF